MRHCLRKKAKELAQQLKTELAKRQEPVRPDGEEEGGGAPGGAEGPRTPIRHDGRGSSGHVRASPWSTKSSRGGR